MEKHRDSYDSAIDYPQVPVCISEKIAGEASTSCGESTADAKGSHSPSSARTARTEHSTARLTRQACQAGTHGPCSLFVSLAVWAFAAAFLAEGFGAIPRTGTQAQERQQLSSSSHQSSFTPTTFLNTTGLLLVDSVGQLLASLYFSVVLLWNEKQNST